MLLNYKEMFKSLYDILVFRNNLDKVKSYKIQKVPVYLIFNTSSIGY